MDAEALVVGAGTAGLACARRLHDAGRSVVVLEKSRGVGGRCATRRVCNAPVDHGLAFYHGKGGDLLEALQDAGRDRVLSGWPLKILGSGRPCQPGSLRPGHWRLAYTTGVTTFHKRLAEGLEVRLDSRLASVESSTDRWRVVDAEGGTHSALDLVLTIPAPQALDLVDSCLGASLDTSSVRALLDEFGYVPSLTVIARYPAGCPAPDWDMCFPEDSAILQLVSHDSSKRSQDTRTVLVSQALPAWSRKHWNQPEADWTAAMLEEACRWAGPWAGEPEVVQTHRWRFARIVSGGDLSGPLLVVTPEGGRLGFAGDGFAPGGGVEAAWRSGRELARRLLEDDTR